MSNTHDTNDAALGADAPWPPVTRKIILALWCLRWYQTHTLRQTIGLGGDAMAEEDAFQLWYKLRPNNQP